MKEVFELGQGRQKDGCSSKADMMREDDRLTV